MEIHEYWQKFLEETEHDEDLSYEAYYFCNNRKDADELAQLVVAGKKRATSSNQLCYEFEHEPLPNVGDINIITDFDNHPICIIQIVQIDIVPFKDITPEMAALEGEGDLSLTYWQNAHRHFFSKDCEEMGIEFSDEIPVVFEQFKVIFI